MFLLAGEQEMGGLMKLAGCRLGSPGSLRSFGAVAAPAGIVFDVLGAGVVVEEADHAAGPVQKMRIDRDSIDGAAKEIGCHHDGSLSGAFLVKESVQGKLEFDGLGEVSLSTGFVIP